MYTSIDSYKINYESFGEGDMILLLHGWGGSFESLKPLGKALEEKGYKICLLDLPGFGKSDKPKNAFSLDDYADLVEKFVKEQEVDSLCVFGHSFGGSVAIKLAVRKNIDIKKLTLCNSSGIRTDRKEINSQLVEFIKGFFSLPLLDKLYPSFRKFFYYYILGNRDYIDHQEISGTFKQVVSEDITAILSKIDVPTFLLWGKRDKDTPLTHAKIMKAYIPDAKLQVVSNAGHGLPKHSPELVAKKIDKFIRSF